MMKAIGYSLKIEDFTERVPYYSTPATLST